MTKVTELLNKLPVFVWQSNRTGRKKIHNSAWLNYAGYECRIINEKWLNAVHPDSVDMIRQTFRKASLSKTKFQIEYQVLSADGKYHWFLDQGTPEYNSLGRFIGFVGTMTNIDEQKNTLTELIFRSTHDALTGLTNFSYFTEYLHTVTSKREPFREILFYADVNGLKRVNDELGHDQGNILILAATKTLQSCFRPEDVVSRLGGDEFGAILTGIETDNLEDFAKEKCEFIQSRIKQYNEESNNPWELQIALGYSIYRGQGADLFVHEADQDMYKNKQEAKPKQFSTTS